MKKIQLLILAIILSTGAMHAQDYRNGIGLRGGLYNGITYKHKFNDKVAFEAIASSRWEGLEFTGLAEFHNQFGSVQNFNWYYGFGGHVGNYHHDHTPYGHHKDHNGTYTTIGADGIIGMEYTFLPVPINISLDYKPAINLIGGNYFASDAAALSVRFVF